ncbi:helix-turn-helix domain-containing protein [Mycobacterium sp. OTB74]|uniref:helix-turn-helix domain-containing protein n=1 Tax=Mycobacterium sp. OTB74 TaxID=1853452 RepID=UPI00247603B2|nr:helix-turn-helix domain-containing protein [Mycobacterium sp. OTB74]MDH6247250.1 excisionase family DNA binding protein [Mycobacterium sp. OTB74]
MLIAVRHRRLSGLPDSSTYHDLAQVFINMSDTGHTDVPEPVAAQYLPTVPIDQAARQLGVSTRQVRRLASQLGGRKIGNQWLLDQTSIDEHLEGKQQWTEQN